MLGGDLRHQRLGAVPAGDTEQVRTAGEGIAGELLHVGVRLVEQRHLGAERLRPLLQVEAGDLAAARARVHDEEGPLRRPGASTTGNSHAERSGRSAVRAASTAAPSSTTARTATHSSRSEMKSTISATGAATANGQRHPAQHAPLLQEPEPGGEHDGDGGDGQQHQPHAATTGERQQHDHREHGQSQTGPRPPSHGLATTPSAHLRRRSVCTTLAVRSGRVLTPPRRFAVPAPSAAADRPDRSPSSGRAAVHPRQVIHGEPPSGEAGRSERASAREWAWPSQIWTPCT